MECCSSSPESLKKQIEELLTSTTGTSFPVDKIFAPIDEIPKPILEFAQARFKQLDLPLLSKETQECLKSISRYTEMCWRFYSLLKPLLVTCLKNDKRLDILEKIVSLLISLSTSLAPLIKTNTKDYQGIPEKLLTKVIDTKTKINYCCCSLSEERKDGYFLEVVDLLKETESLLEEIKFNIEKAHQLKNTRQAVPIITGLLVLYAEVAVLRNNLTWQTLIIFVKNGSDLESSELNRLADSGFKLDMDVMSIVIKDNCNHILKANLICNKDPNESLLEFLLMENFKFDIEGKLHQQSVVLRTVGFLSENWYVSSPHLTTKGTIYLQCKRSDSVKSQFLFLKVGHNCFCITPRGNQYKGYFLSHCDNDYVKLQKVGSESPGLSCQWIILQSPSGFVIISRRDPFKFLCMSNFGFDLKSYLCCKEIKEPSDKEIWTLEN